jgi:hypothetical protein
VDHRVLERLEEVLLKLEVRELLLFEKAHRELPERVERKEADVGVVVAADLRPGESDVGQQMSSANPRRWEMTDLVEVLAEDLPDARPLEPDPGHVVVRDLDELLQAEEARVIRAA